MQHVSDLCVGYCSPKRGTLPTQPLGNETSARPFCGGPQAGRGIADYRAALLSRPRPLLRASALATSVAVLALANVSDALAAGFHKDETPLSKSVTDGSGGTSAIGAGGGVGTIARMIVGLAIVLAVVYGIYWLLKSTNRSRDGRLDRPHRGRRDHAARRQPHAAPAALRR